MADDGVVLATGESFETAELPISEIGVMPGFNHRFERYDEDRLDALAANIVAVGGLVQPMVVQRRTVLERCDDGGYWESRLPEDVEDGTADWVERQWTVVAGHRRLEALRRIEDQVKTASVRIAPDGLKNTEVRLISLSENLHRANLTIAEKAREVARLRDEGVGTGVLEQLLGVTARQVQYLRLVGRDLIDEMFQMLDEGHLTFEKARGYARWPEEVQRWLWSEHAKGAKAFWMFRDFPSYAANMVGQELRKHGRELSTAVFDVELYEGPRWEGVALDAEEFDQHQRRAAQRKLEEAESAGARCAEVTTLDDWQDAPKGEEGVLVVHDDGRGVVVKENQVPTSGTVEEKLARIGYGETAGGGGEDEVAGELRGGAQYFRRWSLRHAREAKTCAIQLCLLEHPSTAMLWVPIVHGILCRSRCFPIQAPRASCIAASIAEELAERLSGLGRQANLSDDARTRMIERYSRVNEHRARELEADEAERVWNALVAMPDDDIERLARLLLVASISSALTDQKFRYMDEGRPTLAGDLPEALWAAATLGITRASETARGEEDPWEGMTKQGWRALAGREGIEVSEGWSGKQIRQAIEAAGELPEWPPWRFGSEAEVHEEIGVALGEVG